MSQGQGGGQPTKYRAEYVDKAVKLCLLGATNEQIADFFEVDITTIYEWKKVHPKFSHALKQGKIDADMDVAKSLYQRAKGYTCKEDKVLTSNNEDGYVVIPTEKHYPPDPTSMIFWLKNRQKDLWREKQDHELLERIKALEDIGDK